MANYHYIIASFPDLLLDFESRSLDRQAVVEEVKSQLSASDCELVDLLEFGLEGKNLSSHFYRLVRKSGCSFLKGYFSFDREVREAKVAFLDGKPSESTSDNYGRFQAIFSESNLIEREKRLDGMMWDKAEELVLFEIFNINTILSLLTRLSIASRWAALDQASGKKLFKQLVDEVRGTFQGINSNNQI